MEILERVFLSFLQCSLTASIVILIVISILKIFNNNISIRVKNALWILVLIKLLVPVVAENNTNVFHILYEKYGSVIQYQSETNNVIEINKSPQISKGNFNSDNYNSNAEISTTYKIQENDDKNLISNIFKTASCIWAIGVAILILTLLLSTFKLKRKIECLENNACDGIVSLLENCKLKVNIKSRIPVYIYDGFTSPCILGVIKPKIYIPKYVLSIKDNNQLSHIFLHELMHYKRKDLIYNFLGTIALVIHWFNPFVWIAVKKMKLYREYACDSCVLELFNEEENTEYGMTILNLSRMLLNENNYSQLPIYFETKNQIKSRIGMIKEFKKGSYKMSTKAVLGCTIAAIVILTNNLTVKALDVNNIIPPTIKDTVIVDDEHKSDVYNVENNDAANVTEIDDAKDGKANNNVADANGKWVQDKGIWYFYNKAGVMQKNVTINIDGKEYSFDETGAWTYDKTVNGTNDVAEETATTNKTNDLENKVADNAVKVNEESNDSAVQGDQKVSAQKNTDGHVVTDSGVYTEAGNKTVSTDAYKQSNKSGEDLNNIKQNDSKNMTGWVLDEGDWYYYNKDGVMEKNTTINDSGREYKLGEDGVLKYWKDK